MKTFTVTKEHLVLLQNSYTAWDYCEFGAASIDPKRPYGNSDVIGDMLSLLNINVEQYEDFAEVPTEIEDRLNQLHKDTQTCLQILLCNLKIEEGIYTEVDYRKWSLLK